MTVKPTGEKRDKIKSLGKKLIHSGQSSIRELAKFIGMIVASFQGVMHGPIRYRRMENDRI